MYVPPNFEQSDAAAIRQLMEEHGFATIVSTANGRPIASHLPTEVRKAPDSSGRLVIEGHMARGNPLWKTLLPDAEVLVIFLGAHSYISPTWYSVASVPTWNYSAVHAYGRPRIVEDRDALRKLLTRLVNRHERANNSPEPFALADLPTEQVDQMMNDIVGFEITVTEIQAAAKLSQNRSEDDFANVIAALKNRSDERSHRVAQAMDRLGRLKSERPGSES